MGHTQGTALALLAAGIFVFPACATKGYVNEQITGVNGKVESLTKTVEETQERTKANEGKINVVDQKVGAAQGAADRPAERGRQLLGRLPRDAADDLFGGEGRLDAHGDCPSVMKLDQDHEYQAIQNVYDLLSRITLLDHSLNVAEQMIDDVDCTRQNNVAAMASILQQVEGLARGFESAPHGASLAESFVIENNPFNPLEQPAVFAYDLEVPSRVEFRVFTLIGEEVYAEDVLKRTVRQTSGPAWADTKGMRFGPSSPEAAAARLKVPTFPPRSQTVRGRTSATNSSTALSLSAVPSAV